MLGGQGCPALDLERPSFPGTCSASAAAFKLLRAYMGSRWGHVASVELAEDSGCLQLLGEMVVFVIVSCHQSRKGLENAQKEVSTSITAWKLHAENLEKTWTEYAEQSHPAEDLKTYQGTITKTLKDISNNAEFKAVKTALSGLKKFKSDVAQAIKNRLKEETKKAPVSLCFLTCDGEPPLPSSSGTCVYGSRPVPEAHDFLICKSQLRKS